jgi:hypothetical protein
MEPENQTSLNRPNRIVPLNTEVNILKGESFKTNPNVVRFDFTKADKLLAKLNTLVAPGTGVELHTYFYVLYLGLKVGESNAILNSKTDCSKEFLEISPFYRKNSRPLAFLIKDNSSPKEFKQFTQTLATLKCYYKRWPNSKANTLVNFYKVKIKDEVPLCEERPFKRFREELASWWPISRALERLKAQQEISPKVIEVIQSKVELDILQRFFCYTLQNLEGDIDEGKNMPLYKRITELAKINYTIDQQRTTFDKAFVSMNRKVNIFVDAEAKKPLCPIYKISCGLVCDLLLTLYRDDLSVRLSKLFSIDNELSERLVSCLKNRFIELYNNDIYESLNCGYKKLKLEQRKEKSVRNQALLKALAVIQLLDSELAEPITKQKSGALFIANYTRWTIAKKFLLNNRKFLFASFINTLSEEGFVDFKFNTENISFFSNSKTCDKKMQVASHLYMSGEGYFVNTLYGKALASLSFAVRSLPISSNQISSK